MKYNKPKYIEWFIKSTDDYKLTTGEKVIVYSLNHNLNQTILDDWGKHIAKHYIDDDQALKRAEQLNISKYEYLYNYWLDLKGKDISGNFAEIVLSDFLEYVENYEVPRYKLYNNYPGNPQQGIDIFGFKIFNEGMNYSDKDILNFMEVKAILRKSDVTTIVNSVDDIKKRDDKTFALILENAHERLRCYNCHDEVLLIERFQDSEKPYIRSLSSGAITITSKNLEADILGLKIDNAEGITIHLIHGNDLLDLAKDLYKRACK